MGLGIIIKQLDWKEFIYLTSQKQRPMTETEVISSALL